MTLPWFAPEPIRIPFIPGGGAFEEIVVHPFGMLVALGVLLGVQVAMKKATRDGLHSSVVGELAGYQLVFAFVIGHVFDALFYHWDVVRVRPMLVLELWNGLSSFGGFVGAAIGSVVWVRLRRASFLAFADPIAFSFPFGWLFGRIGCFLVHDHPGRVTDFFLGVEDYRVRGESPPWQVRHDLGLYEVFWSLGAIALFLVLAQKRRRRGFYLALLPLIYAPVRFGLDFLRATDVMHHDPRLLGLTPAHYGAVVLFAAGLAVAYRVWTTEDPRIAPETRWFGATRERLGRASERDEARVLEPSEAERATFAARWPGELVVIDLRGRAAEIDRAAIATELRALGQAQQHVWVLDADALAAIEPATLARTSAAERAPALVIAIGEGLPGLDALRAQGVEVHALDDDDEEPFAVLERDDGGRDLWLRPA